MKKGDKKGQVTIFIIVAIVIVGVILLLFLISTGRVPIGPGPREEINPNEYLSNCIKDPVKNKVELISKQGGYVSNPLNISFTFTKLGETSPTEIAYLCYNRNNEYPCVNQEPLLIPHLKDEIKNSISKDVRNCWDEFTTSLKNAGYVVDAKYTDFLVDMKSGKIIIYVDGSLTLTKGDETSRLEKFEMEVPSNLYEIAGVVQEIVNEEGKSCSFDSAEYTINNPEFSIEVFNTGTPLKTKFYTVKYKKTSEWFRFAIKGCSNPPEIY